MKKFSDPFEHNLHGDWPSPWWATLISCVAILAGLVAQIEKAILLTGVLDAVTCRFQMDRACVELWWFACQYKLERMLPNLEKKLMSYTTSASIMNLDLAGQGILEMSSRGLHCAAISFLRMLKEALMREKSGVGVRNPEAWNVRGHLCLRDVWETAEEDL